MLHRYNYSYTDTTSGISTDYECDNRYIYIYNNR